MKFATAATLATAQAIHRSDPFDEVNILPPCPSKDEPYMDDGHTEVVRAPHVDATCTLQVGGLSLVMLGGEPEAKPAVKADEKADVANPDATADAAKAVATGKKADESGKPAEKKESFVGLKGLEHCPDWNERFTLANGRTRAIKYPEAGYNCTNEYGLAQGDESAELGGKPAAKKAAPAAPTAVVASPSLDHLEHCPDFNERYTLRNGTIMAVPYPKAGFNCNWSLAQAPVVASPSLDHLEHCPDFNERYTLRNGTDMAIPYPKTGFNCNWSLAQVEPTTAKPSLDHLEHCPDFNERYTLRNGTDMAIPYPKTGFNCNWSLAQVEPTVGAPSLDHLEHCPDFNERYTLRNGTDMAVPYPKAGFNCNWSLAQVDGPWPANVAPANIPVPATSAYPAGLEHCPDRPERQTLRNGTVRAVPFPKAGYNCIPDIYPGVAGVPWPYALAQGQATPWPANVVAPNIPVGADAAYPAGLEHCPDRPERETLRNGTTKAVPFPTAGYNCIADAYPGVAGTPWPYALAQATPWPANVAPANIPVPAASAYPAGLEHCPDRPERETLRNGTTKAVAFPAKGYNCMPDAYPAVAGVPWPYALAQATPWPANVAPANISVPAGAAYPAGLEHCPDLPERQTLRDGLTKPIPFPAAGANCKADIYPGKEGVPAPYH